MTFNTVNNLNTYPNFIFRANEQSGIQNSSQQNVNNVSLKIINQPYLIFNPLNIQPNLTENRPLSSMSNTDPARLVQSFLPGDYALLKGDELTFADFFQTDAPLTDSTQSLFSHLGLAENSYVTPPSNRNPSSSYPPIPPPSLEQKTRTESSQDLILNDLANEALELLLEEDGFSPEELKDDNLEKISRDLENEIKTKSNFEILYKSYQDRKIACYYKQGHFALALIDLHSIHDALLHVGNQNGMVSISLNLYRDLIQALIELKLHHPMRSDQIDDLLMRFINSSTFQFTRPIPPIFNEFIAILYFIKGDYNTTLQLIQETPVFKQQQITRRKCLQSLIEIVTNDLKIKEKQHTFQKAAPISTYSPPPLTIQDTIPPTLIQNESPVPPKTNPAKKRKQNVRNTNKA